MDRKSIILVFLFIAIIVLSLILSSVLRTAIVTAIVSAIVSAILVPFIVYVVKNWDDLQYKIGKIKIRICSSEARANEDPADDPAAAMPLPPSTKQDNFDDLDVRDDIPTSLAGMYNDQSAPGHTLSNGAIDMAEMSLFDGIADAEDLAALSGKESLGPKPRAVPNDTSSRLPEKVLGAMSIGVPVSLADSWRLSENYSGYGPNATLKEIYNQGLQDQTTLDEKMNEIMMERRRREERQTTARHAQTNDYFSHYRRAELDYNERKAWWEHEF